MILVFKIATQHVTLDFTITATVHHDAVTFQITVQGD